jgi:hypothetical protein
VHHLLAYPFFPGFAVECKRFTVVENEVILPKVLVTERLVGALHHHVWVLGVGPASVHPEHGPEAPVVLVPVELMALLLHPPETAHTRLPHRARVVCRRGERHVVQPVRAYILAPLLRRNPAEMYHPVVPHVYPMMVVRLPHPIRVDLVPSPQLTRFHPLLRPQPHTKLTSQARSLVLPATQQQKSNKFQLHNTSILQLATSHVNLDSESTCEEYYYRRREETIGW